MVRYSGGKQKKIMFGQMFVVARHEDLLLSPQGKLEIAGVLEEESQGHKALKGLLDLLDMVVETGLKERLATQEHLVALADLDPPYVNLASSLAS